MKTVGMTEILIITLKSVSPFYLLSWISQNHILN